MTTETATIARIRHDFTDSLSESWFTVRDGRWHISTVPKPGDYPNHTKPHATKCGLMLVPYNVTWNDSPIKEWALPGWINAYVCKHCTRA